jgi:hypothetical protein
MKREARPRTLAIIRRRLFAALSVLSLMMCATAAALWIRSFWTADQIMFRGTNRINSLISDRGTLLLFSRARVPGDGSSKWMMSHARPGIFQFFVVRSREEHRWLQLRGIGYCRVPVVTVPTETSTTLTVILLSHWVLFLLTGVLPTYWLTKRLRVLARIRRGHCPVCGYNLRATPERCPECGNKA